MSGIQGSVMVYRNRRLRCWSVMQRGRVVAHMESLALLNVIFRVRPAGRARACRVGQRNVHAFACGRPVDFCGLPAFALQVRYDPGGPGAFTLVDGTAVGGAHHAYFVPTGAFVEEPWTF